MIGLLLYNLEINWVAHIREILFIGTGKRAADEGRDSRYPDLDFCKDPGLICSRDDHKELKWIAGENVC